MKMAIRLKDFVPPIVTKSVKLIKKLFWTGENTTSSGIQPFMSSAMGSYSQFNEDLLLEVLFSFKNVGSYLDIGANDPSFNSNTKRFYDKGWTGINIEPGPEGYNKFTHLRNKDLNLNIGIGPENSTMTFYQVVGDSTLSSFNKLIAQKMAKQYEHTVAEISIPVMRLESVFQTYVMDRQIDFMSVDAEGYDLEVLTSNDWNKYRPSVVMVEIDNQYKKIVSFLHSQNYCLIFNNLHNGIFLDTRTSEKAILTIAQRCLQS
jgi:FkbM family methyltransferase